MNTTLNMTPKDIIETLELKPHPEGGWYRQTWCGDEQPRACGTSIYFLLEAHQHSRWHKVDAVEIWHWYAGSPMELHMHEDGNTKVKVLGPDISSDHRPQLLVPAHTWQQSIPIKGWVLVGCTVSPGFQFSGFELADENWSPATAEI